MIGFFASNRSLAQNKPSQSNALHAASSNRHECSNVYFEFSARSTGRAWTQMFCLESVISKLSSLTLCALALLPSCGSSSQQAKTLKDAAASDLSLALHYTNGVTGRSTTTTKSLREKERPEVILFADHTHIHLKFSNNSENELLIWKHYCPQGDRAMRIEFRNPDKPDEIRTSRLRRDYTGGMGIPKVVKLAPSDDYIVDIDFLADWKIPFALGVREQVVMEMRAVYESTPMDSEEILYNEFLLGDRFSPMARSVWTGTVASPWDQVVVINRTGTSQ